jgi:cytosine/adenosine deaminase-related metal-dependent hydrolase
MKTFALVQKHAANDAAALDAAETWQIATGQKAPALGAAQALAVGQPADFLLLRAGAPELSFGELPAALVYAASGGVVETTVVAGRALMRNGEIDDAEEVLAQAVERARRLGLAPRAASPHPPSAASADPPPAASPHPPPAASPDPPPARTATS